MHPIIHTEDRLSNFGKLLCLFGALYPLVLFPGALWYHPQIIGSEELARALEQYQLFPKILVLLLTGLLGVLSIRTFKWREPLVALMLGYLALVALSIGFSGEYSSFSWLGPNQRMDGLLYQTGLVLLGITAYQLLQSRPKFFVPILNALLLGAVIQCAIIVLQRIGLDFVGALVKFGPYQSPVGTLNHQGMAAGFLLPMVFVSLYLFLYSDRQRWFLLGVVFLIGLGLAISGNRSSFYALIVVLVLINLWYRDSRVLLISLVTLAGFGTIKIIPNKQGFEKSYTQTNTLQTRSLIWPMALRMVGYIPGQPFIGGGTEAFVNAQAKALPFDLLGRIYPIEFAGAGWPKDTKLERIEVINTDKVPRDQSLRFYFEQGKKVEFSFYFDKAHNMILDRLLPYGGIAALICIWLYLWPVWQILQKRNRKQTLLGWALLVLFIYYLAWFPVVQTEPIHWLIVVLAWIGIENPQPELPDRGTTSKTKTHFSPTTKSP